MLIYKIFAISLLTFASGRHVRISTNSQTEMDRESLKRLLKYYRDNEGHLVGSLEGPASMESHFPTERFRLDFSTGFQQEMIPFAEDIPIGSEGTSETSPKPKPIVTFQEDDDQVVPGDHLFGPIPVAPVIHVTTESSTTQQAVSTTNTSNTDEEPETEVTTLPSSSSKSENPAELEHIPGSILQVPFYKDGEDESKDEYNNDEDDEEDDDEDSEEECIEGETKRLKCNNACVCVDGVFFCSKRKCGNENNTGTTNHSFMKTTVQTVKKHWGSNIKKEQETTPSPTCKNGMTKRIDCNKCICALEKWSCTKNSCIALTLREKASYTDGVSLYNEVDTLIEKKDFDEDCNEDSTKQMMCNYCVCNWNSWACTNYTCGATSSPKTKEIYEACRRNGEVKSKGCNLCRCTKGIWICSNNDCKSFNDRQDAAAPPSFRTLSKLTKT